MHGVSEQDEIAYWRERAEKAERERDEARLVAATSERESIAYREHLSTLSWAATELRRLEGISVDDTQIATLVVDHARMRDENERLTRERDEARKLAADMAKEQAEARGRNMMAQRYVDELAHDIAVVTQHRKAQSSGGQHVGTGGRLGNTPPSTLAYLERLVADLRAVLGKEQP